jgi:alanine dehydrogenase
VYVERGAGLGSGFSDEQYRGAGRRDPRRRRGGVGARRDDHEGEGADPGRVPRIREGQILFTYFHFAADER